MWGAGTNCTLSKKNSYQNLRMLKKNPADDIQHPLTISGANTHAHTTQRGG